MNNLSIFAALTALISVAVIAGCVGQSSQKCTTADCFALAANDCKAATLTINQSYGVVAFTSFDNCTYTERIVNIVNDTPAIKDVLENRSMDCTYDKGGFDVDWIKDVVLSATNCRGDLRETLGQLSLLYATSLNSTG